MVDDDKSVLQATKYLLDGWGLRGSYAATAEEALELIRRGEHRFDIALLDFRLPDDWTGVKLYSEISLLLGYQLPTILLTGDIAVDKLREVQKSGLPILHKPIETSDLYSLIKQKPMPRTVSK